MNSLKLKQKQYNFSWISECRGALMGFAALWVALFHSLYLSFDFLHFKILFLACDFIKSHGNAGVDIFLILSGLGLYYSFEKNSNIFEFYKKRFFRVFPAAFIVAVIYYGLTEKSVSIKHFISDILFFDFYCSGRRSFWYFSLIFVLYALYPLIHKFIKTKPTRRIWVLIIATVVLNILLFVLFKDYYKKTEIAFSRIPIFLVGVLLGYLSKNNKEISLLRCMPIAVIVLISAFLIFFFYEVPIGAERLLCGVIGFSVIMILSYFFHQYKINAVRNILLLFGLYSMEIYLFYERIVFFLDGKIAFSCYNICFYIFAFVITMVASVLLKTTVDSILSVSQMSKNKRH